MNCLKLLYQYKRFVYPMIVLGYSGQKEKKTEVSNSGIIDYPHSSQLNSQAASQLAI